MIGAIVNTLAENERHCVFANHTGLVPTHMPWIFTICVDWMVRYPCKSNNVYLINNAVVDANGRFLTGESQLVRLTCNSSMLLRAERSAKLFAKTFGLKNAMSERTEECDYISRLIPKGGVNTIPARASFVGTMMDT
eukprot:899454-Amphidinium_carterae.3